VINARPQSVDGGGLQFAEVRVQVHDAQGRVTRDEVVDSFESAAHRVKRHARKLATPLLVLLLLGACAAGKADIHHALPAATVITNVGQSIVTNRMISAGTEPKYVAWGTGAGTAAITDTTLFTESTDEARTNGTSSRVTTTVTNDTYQVVGLMTVATTNKTITNCGLFDASTTGNMYFKSDFTGIALLIGEAITFTIKVKFA
jgi:hypothetical protein